MVKNLNDLLNLKELSSDELVTLILREKGSYKRTLQEELYDRYVEATYNRCYFLTKNKEDAKDLCHDIFIKVFLKLSSYKGPNSFPGWVSVITYNTSLKHIKKRNKNAFEDIDENPNIVEETPNNFEVLNDSLAKLPEEIRFLLSMKYYDKLSIKEIAAYLNISESAVKMRLKRGKEFLKNIIETANEKI